MDKIQLIRTRDIHLFIPIMQEIEMGDRFFLSMLHWCGIGERSKPLQFWEVSLAMAIDTPVGVCGLYQNIGMEKGIAWISWLGVRKPFRKQGLGSTMLDLLIEHAKKAHKFSELWVYTDGDLTNVHRYYERAGFVDMGEGANVAPDVVMNPDDRVFQLKL